NLGRRIAAEAQNELAVGRHTHRSAVERERCAGGCLAAGEPPLAQDALERDRIVGRSRRRQRKQQRRRLHKAPHNSSPCDESPGLGLRLRGPSATTSALPSWNCRPSRAPEGIASAETITLPSGPQTRT